MSVALHIDPAKAASAAGRNMISIASGKGGVGKTWFAITLTQALAGDGRKALLFDGDLGLANVDIQLGLAPDHDLGGALDGRHSLARAATACDEGGFEVIAGRSGSGNLANLPSGRLAELIGDLRRLAPAYQAVVLDLAAGIEHNTRALALAAATCLVVTTDEPTALTDAYAFVKLALAADPDADLRIVVNMAETDTEGERTYATLRKACESFLKTSPPLAGIIHRDAKVKESIRNQTPTLTRHPNCRAAQDVRDLARRVLERP